MTDGTYNGWANYETWVAGMYLDGNYTGESTYLEVLDLVRGAMTERSGLLDSLTPDELEAVRGADVYDVACALKDHFDVLLDDTGLEGIMRDLLAAAVGEIDWRELAVAKIVEVTEG